MNIIWEWAKENLDLDEITRAKFMELAHEKWLSRLLSRLWGSPTGEVMFGLLNLDKDGKGITSERLPHLSETYQRRLGFLSEAQLITIDEGNDMIRINYDNLLQLVGTKEHD